MNGKISFVGAGPGAPDLMTLRGAGLLKEADTVIYAGSLVNEKILETAPSARLYNSAKLALPEVIRILEEEYRAGRNVVRLHTGDPAMYGAVSEQFRELDRLGIPYEVVPGVSSVFAAAAALKTELTMPSLSQSVILTRDAGRTPVPEAESLEKLAAHGTTLCIFLSVGGMKELCAKLLAAGRSPETPAAVVYRASWENQKIVRGTISDLPERVEAAGIKRQAMIVVGEVLNRNGALSKLYDAEFATGFRHHRFSGNVALFALTRSAVVKAAEIAAGLAEGTVFCPEKFSGSVSSRRSVPFAEGGFGAMLESVWKEYDAFVFVMAAGIAVRRIGRLCADKKTDPAAVVCDESGNYAVSLLSGHVGGGNDLARDIARITGGKPVITTASDVADLPAPDVFAKRFHYEITTPGTLTALSAAVVNGEAVSVEMPGSLFESEFSRCPQFALLRDRRDGILEFHASGTVLRMRKFFFALGIGCRKNVPAERIAEVVSSVLRTHGFSMTEISVIASASAKREERGLLEFAAKEGKELRFYSPEELNAVPVPNPSSAAKRYLGANSVSEASALLAAGGDSVLFLEKQAEADVTVALAGGPAHE